MAENSPKPVENTVGNVEISHNKQFLLFLQCFQKTCTYCRPVRTRACLGQGYECFMNMKPEFLLVTCNL